MLQASVEIVFDLSKGQDFDISKFRAISKQYKTAIIKEELEEEQLKQYQNAVLVVLAPQAAYSQAEFDAILAFVAAGGSLFFAGDNKSNFNFLLEEFGISVNSDTVTRPQFYKYFYPQEAFVQDGVINRSILEACDKKLSFMGNREQLPPVPFSPLKLSAQEHKDQRNLALLYPYGATLTIQRPAACIMSSGSCTYPFNQPLGAICAKNGRICVFGSHLMFAEEYVDREENRKLLDVLLKWLTGQLALTVMEADEPDITNYHFTPSIEKLARMPRGCLEEPDALPEDIDLQFRLDTLKLDGRLIGDVIGLYNELGMRREALKLIQPKFETPLPPLQLAVFPPEIKGSNPPQLELFDFDQEFASEKTRLAQLANRCTDEDLGFFIQECGRTLGIKGSSPKSILEYAVTRLVQWKLSPQ